MKAVLPQLIQPLTRVLHIRGINTLVLGVPIVISYDTRALRCSSITQLTRGRNVVDENGPKCRGEALVTGSAFTVRAVVAAQVRVVLSQIDKRLYAIGDRCWVGGVSSEPVPFSQIPLDWSCAFGGYGHALNPVGKGYAPIEIDGKRVHQLPNIEDPKHLIQSPGDRPAPAGFGPIDITSPERLRKLGTYDAEWLEERFPGFPDDLDPSAFNVAPQDQQIDGFWRGDEPFRIENMHPTKPVLEGRLPGLAARVFVTQRTKDGDVFKEVPTHLDTVHFFPHLERVLLIFRGVTPVASDDAADIVHLLAGLEHMDAPKPAAHYRGVLDRRLDKDKGFLQALRDDELLPEPREGFSAEREKTDFERALATDGLTRKRARRRAELAHARGLEQVRAHGLDPIALGFSETLPPEEPEPSLEELPAFVERAKEQADKMRIEAEQKKAEAEADARELFEEQGLDYDATMKAKDVGGPPKFSAAEEIAKLEDLRQLSLNSGVPLADVDAMLGDPELPGRLQNTERELQDAYRKFGHHFPPAPEVSADEARRLGAAMVAAIAAGETIANRDFSRADLSGADLRGADLRNAFLEGSRLVGADLSGAQLGGAMLARSDLRDSVLRDADLSGANLGSVAFAGADFTDTNLHKAVLAKADLGRGRFDGANFEGAQLFDASFCGASLARVRAPNATFMKADLSGIDATGALFDKAIFLEVTAHRADFSGAHLGRAVFVNAQADDCLFRGAKAERLCAVQGSSLERARFEGARLESANLRGTKLADADFTEAELADADLSECDLQRSSFRGTRARGARFVRADLTGACVDRADFLGAILQKAKLHKTDFRGASLFRADLAEVRGDQETSFEGANIGQVRVVRVRDHGQE